MKSLEERLTLFIDKGWTCNSETGDVFSHTGKLINRITKEGYINCGLKINGKSYNLSAHHLVYYLKTGKVPKLLDHINRMRTDNRFENLREVTHQENQFNTKAKS